MSKRHITAIPGNVPGTPAGPTEPALVNQAPAASGAAVPKRRGRKPLTPQEKQQRAAARRALPSNLHPEMRLHVQQVCTLTGDSRSKIYDELRFGRFPQPERRGLRHTRWRCADVLAYLEQRRLSGAE
jgi:predicted DNA-binding transcriptional regulator AlpA